MFYMDGKLQYPVRVERPNPVFAKALQQAIGGVEGEIRVCLQYLFQGWGSRGPKKYRDMLLNTGAEEIGHIEMLSTAVALNLEKAPLSFQEEAAANPIAGAVLNGMNLRHILSTGLAATPEDANGVPFNASHVYASGNIAGDMLANATAEATGRALAVRLHNMTDDPGMKDMLSFNIARDTMHQQQWLAVIEELGGLESQLPMPNSFPQAKENAEFRHVFLDTRIGSDVAPLEGRFTQGPSLDGTGEFSVRNAEPHGTEPTLAAPKPSGFAQKEQMTAATGVLGLLIGVCLTAAVSSRHGEPLGRPAAAPGGQGGYAFLDEHPEGSGRPVTFDPCLPIHYVVRPDGQPPSAPQMVAAAVDEVSRATGLVFVHDGATDEGPSQDRHLEGRWSLRSRTPAVLIAWATEAEWPSLAGNIVGEAGPVTRSFAGSAPRYITGQVVLDATDLAHAPGDALGAEQVRLVAMHELGHLVGLGHVDDPTELMHAETGRALSGFGPGDRRGLHSLGSGDCA